MYSGSNGTFDDEYIRYVLDAYSVTIIRLCRTYVKSIHDAEDIAQDTFLELIRRRPEFMDSEHEKAWLMRTAINKCKNHLKSGWVSKTVSLEDNSPSEIEQEGSSPEEAADSTVFDAVMALPEKYRTVIHLYYYDGYSLQDISEICRMSIATAGTRLARGRALLKKQLGDDL